MYLHILDSANPFRVNGTFTSLRVEVPCMFVILVHYEIFLTRAMCTDILVDVFISRKPCLPWLSKSFYCSEIIYLFRVSFNDAP